MSRSISRLLFGGVLTIALLVTHPSVVGAQTDEPVDLSELAVLGGSFEEMMAAVDEAVDALYEVNERLSELDEERAELERGIDELGRQRKRLETEAKRLRRSIKRLDTNIGDKRDRIAGLRELLTKRAVVAYVSGTSSLAEGLISPQYIEDADDIAVFLEALNDSDDELARRIQREAAALERDRVAQRASRVKLGRKITTLDEAAERLQDKAEDLARVIEETEAEAEEAEKMAERALALSELVSRSSDATTIDGRPTCTTHGLVVACDIVGQVARMFAAAKADGVELGGSGWRSTARQIELRAKHCGGDVFGASASACSPPTARPGSSQHERGLAIDFSNCSSRSSACFRWLADNAAEFGFKNLPSEPWHWSTTGN